MKKLDILNAIQEKGLVAVVRASNSEEAHKIALACMNGGVNAIEVTFTVPGADKVITELKSQFKNDLYVGAGTVLDSETARIAILAGAEYIVSPAFDLDTAKLCNRYQIPYMAGCFSLTEMIKAMEAGVDIVKLFPGSAFGPDIVKAIKGPLPQANIMPTGGVNIDNVGTWFKNGVVAVGVGGGLTKGTSEEITEKAKEFLSKIEAARN